MCTWMRYYYWCVSSVDGLGIQTETSKFVLRVFISSQQVKPWTKELLRNCTFPCFLLLSVLGTWDCYSVWVTLRWTKCRSAYNLVTSHCLVVTRNMQLFKTVAAGKRPDSCPNHLYFGLTLYLTGISFVLWITVYSDYLVSGCQRS